MRALICGVSGQDGAYLGEFLLRKGYEVFGTSRDALLSGFHNLRALGIYEQISTVSMDVHDFRSILQVVEKIKPDEIYNLSGQTSVGLSFDQPVEAIESIVLGTLNLLEVVRFLNPSIRYYNASSGDCFGDTGECLAVEETPFKPVSPYAVAKSSAHFLVQNYRLAYGLYACSGILFNHESPLRPSRFVTQKIVLAAAKISRGSKERLSLGNLSIARDWGWAPDYVDAMWRMLQQKNPDDYIVATGKTITLEMFVEKSFAFFGLDWKKHVDLDDSLIRPSDIAVSRGSAAKAHRLLNWKATTNIDGVISNMCIAAKDRISNLN